MLKVEDIENLDVHAYAGFPKLISVRFTIGKYAYGFWIENFAENGEQANWIARPKITKVRRSDGGLSKFLDGYSFEAKAVWSECVRRVFENNMIEGAIREMEQREARKTALANKPSDN